MTLATIDVGRAFYSRLANRDQTQGDGQHTAVEFRGKYLVSLEDESAWNTDEPAVVLDFANVRKIGPSFANEAFGHFARFAPPDRIKRKIRIINASRVQMLIIEEELDAAYRNK